MYEEEGVENPRKITDVIYGSPLKHLSDFLHREEGAQDVINFKFDGNLTCDEPAPAIMATKLGAFTYNDFDGPTQHIPAKDEVERIVKVNTQSFFPTWSTSLIAKCT